MRVVLAALTVVACLAGFSATRAIEFGDLPGALLAKLEPPVTTAAQFDRLREDINNSTAERIRTGEQEALAYFILQSGSFTARPRIEPAVSARAFAESDGAVPADVRARIGDFLAAAKLPASDERLRWFAAGHSTEQDCVTAYRRAAAFLYRRPDAGNAPRADVYQNRGLSTDTHIEANTAVLAALDSIGARAPGKRLNRILIVGPGLEFAPRSGLRDLPPQSFQPYVVLDGLLRRKLADAGEVSIDCVDVNPQVTRFIQDFPRRKLPALLMPGVTPEASAIGTWRGESLEIRPEMAGRVSAAELNIITERYTAPAEYDLVIATNVLIYFDSNELALALANIHAMLRPGGWLMHNESRPGLDRLARAVELPTVETKAVSLGRSAAGAAMDLYVLHQKQ